MEMSDSVDAIRYSKALFRIALDEKKLNECQSGLRKIASVVDDTSLFTLLESDKVSFNNKAKVLVERLGDINPLVLKLLSQLMTKGRLSIINEIADEYQRLLDNHRGIEGAEIAEVTTAVSLDDEYKLKLAQRITNIFGKPVVLKHTLDSSVIGGIIIRVGDKLIDGSIRSKLMKLKKELSEYGR
jgi:F-type H+-transporting ATPase subunit delta